MYDNIEESCLRFNPASGFGKVVTCSYQFGPCRNRFRHTINYLTCICCFI